jgi:hypothetical protein
MLSPLVPCPLPKGEGTEEEVILVASYLMSNKALYNFNVYDGAVKGKFQRFSAQKRLLYTTIVCV